MKKIIVFLFPFWTVYGFAQDSSRVYNMQFKSIDSSNINVSQFEGKQLLIVEFNASNPNRSQLRSLDSLYRRRANFLQIIGIPVNNSDTTVTKSTLVELLRDTLKLSFIIADVGKAKRNANSNQHPLLKWATHVSSNKHFDADIEDDGRMFIISRKGVLYASLGGLTSINGTFMQKALNNPQESD